MTRWKSFSRKAKIRKMEMQEAYKTESIARKFGDEKYGRGNYIVKKLTRNDVKKNKKLMTSSWVGWWTIIKKHNKK